MKIPILLILMMCFLGISCQKQSVEPDGNIGITYSLEKFCMGADLSYVNQVEDHGGIFKELSKEKDPFVLFKNHGCNLVRVRLWNHPLWTREIYGTEGTQMYSDLADAEKTIRRAKDAGMGVNLDFHYSDTWADPANQTLPQSWQGIKTLKVLKDSIYEFTFNTLKYLDSKGLMPEMVQIGNEINCGMLMTEVPPGFPDLNACNGHWIDLGEVINSAIQAVRDASSVSAVKPQVILHIADPKNTVWWFDNIKSVGKVTDFDIIGMSYYPLWHTEIAFDNLVTTISSIRSRYSKKVMLVETAYPWTKDGNDNFNNLFGSQAPLTGFPFTQKGQLDYMVSLTQKVISAGGSGVMVWEPAWITSGLKTPWGNGSAWENSTFFDFEGNVLSGIDFMNQPYVFPSPK
jgi:arabinogalactan endo-1,4-beta-galactosidase